MTNEHNTPPVAAPAPAEPFGYFRVDALGWTDCAATDEGAIALYERPAAPAVPNVLKRGYGRLIQAAADLALQQFMPSDIVDDYPSKTISAAKVAKMMTQPRDMLRLLSIEVSEGAKQMLAATHAAPSQEHAVNLSCRSTQARLAAQWGYVPAPSQEPAVPQGWTDADSDAARLALELECLLLDTENLSVVSKWWASANEALELHRRRLTTPAPSQPVTLTDEVTKNAARYVWLRDVHIGNSPESINLNPVKKGGLDAAIDALREKGELR